jgi:hypothetical protein
MFRSIIYRDVSADDDDAREVGRTYGGTDITPGDEFTKVDDVVQPTGAATIPARTSARIESSKAIRVAKCNEVVGRHWRWSELLSCEGLLLSV